MSTRIGTSGWYSVVAGKPSHTGSRDLSVAVRSNFKDQQNAGITENNHETTIVIGGEKSSGGPVKGHYQKKDGVVTSLLAAKTVEARCSSLTKKWIRTG